ncbi:MAG: tRNA preQ1(34) S-adenosylmethionine ribosyltransferase-isomerase QueA [Candidatus Woesearchaeota archaeon]
MRPEDFDYRLPENLIAQRPAKPKDSSRLMVVKRAKEGIAVEHKRFHDIISYLEKDDVLVINETRVSRAKLTGRKITGSRAEIMLTERISKTDLRARVKGRGVRKGNRYSFGDGLECEIIDSEDDIFTVRFSRPPKEEEMELPLPPYVTEKISDDSEYQTVYSREDGSLAAPTAGLHFTEKLLERIKRKGVKIARICLHIDFGTFLPVRGKLEEHRMHEEHYEINSEAAEMINSRKGRLIAVGTTSVRALESSSDKKGNVIPGKGRTGIFIYPGYRFRLEYDAMITNFHLPKSSLLMLVSAYFGRESILAAYEEAVKERYRFYSLGDSMMLIP